MAVLAAITLYSLPFFQDVQQRMSQPTLFYSNRCAYCRQVLQTMDTMQKSSLVNAVCIDGMQRHQLPPFLKKVPTL